MAVAVKYVVVRKGEEKMTFASKKEADAYDKMLDLADSLSEWLSHASVSLDESDREALGFYLAENKDTLSQLLRGISAAESASSAEKAPKAGREKAQAVAPVEDEDEAA